jgi:ribokinase
MGRRSTAASERGDAVATVCVIGSSNLDFTVPVPRLPGVGETVSGGTLVTSPGGKGANQAVAARRLGADVTFVTLLGADAMGDRLAAALAEAGLPSGPIGRTRQVPTGVALIAVDPQGRNQIAVAPGANHRLAPEWVQRHADLVAGAEVVLLQLETPIETVRWALAEARRRGRRTVLNPAPARVLPLPADLLPLVDYLTPNETEAGLLTDREVRSPDDAEAAGRALVDRGVSTAVVTLGAMGAVAVRASGALRIAAFPVDAIDTVGAGDAFNGALAASLAAGASLEDALLIASAAGGLTCTRRGAVDAMPTREEVVALMRRHDRWPGSAWSKGWAR